MVSIFGTQSMKSHSSIQRFFSESKKKFAPEPAIQGTEPTRSGERETSGGEKIARNRKLVCDINTGRYINIGINITDI